MRAPLRLLSAAAVGGSALLIGAGPASAADRPVTYGITNLGRLMYWDRTNPTVTYPIGTVVAPAGEKIIGIDFRPAAPTELYMVTKVLPTSGPASGPGAGKLYSVSTTTAVATPLATLGVQIEGGDADIDFNPVADALRIITTTGQNLRVTKTQATNCAGTAGTSGIANTSLSAGNIFGFTCRDGDLNYSGVVATQIAGAGYVAPSGSPAATTQYDIDAKNDRLVIQASNPGTLTTVGQLLLGSTQIDVNTLQGFDIDGRTAYLAAQTLDSDGSTSTASRYFEVNLDTGALTDLGDVNEDLLQSMTLGTRSDGAPTPVVPEAGFAVLLPLAALATAGASTVVLRRRRAA